jgi:outer membrane protein insertion porin family
MNHSSLTRIIMRLRIILLTAVILSAVTIEVHPSIASTDSTSAATSATNLRGTEKPLERNASAVQHAGRALLAVPYAGIHVVSWPVYKLLQINERYIIMPRLAKLLYLNYEAGGMRTSLFFGYETNIGLGIVGLNATADDWPVEGAEFELSGGYFTVDENLAAFKYRTKPSLLRLEILGELENKRERPFFGIGPNSPDRRFAANRQRRLGELTVSLHISDEFTAAATTYARDTKLSPSTGDEVPVNIGFPETFLSAERNQYVGLESSIIYNTRNAEDFSTRGQLVRLTAGVNKARSQVDADYRHFECELQTHLNLYRNTRVLALRVFTEGVDSRDPALIPYTELPRLGGKTGFRGYNRYRFADRSSMLISLDYRYPVTQRVRGFIFSEWGTVASKWEKLRLADIDPCFGIGLSFAGLGPPVVFHIAHSPEGYQVYFGKETIFSSESRRLR